MEHQVKFSVPEREVGNVGIKFVVRKNSQKFGTLKISKGKIIWTPKDDQYGKIISWSAFDEFMQENGRTEKH